VVVSAVIVALVGILGFVLIDHVHAAGKAPAQLTTIAGLTGPAVPVDQTPQQRAIAQHKAALAHELQLVIQHKESLAVFETHLLSFYHQFGSAKTYQHALAVLRQRMAAAPHCVNVVSTGASSQPQCGPLGVASLNVAQEPEQYYYWCGPATGAVVLLADGFPYGPRGEHLINDSNNSDDYANEKALTHYLGWWGTNWSQYDSNTGQYYSPMQSMLNPWISGGYYAVVNGSGVGGGFSTSNLASYVVDDVSTGWAVAGGMWLDSSDTTRLPGYPQGISFGHWIPIVGYSGLGADIWYDDPVYHSPDPNLQWPGVPGPTASVTADVMANVLNTRGVIW
jgi:hypothetical protein